MQHKTETKTAVSNANSAYIHTYYRCHRSKILSAGCGLPWKLQNTED